MPRPLTSAGKTQILLLVCLCLPPLFWAGNFIVGRGARGDIPGIVLAWGRWVIAFAVLLPFAAGAIRRDIPIYRDNLKAFIGIGLTSVTLFNTLIYIGLQSTQATNGMLLNSTIPVLILLIGVVFYRRRLVLAQVLGLCLSLCGVAVVILRGDLDRLLGLQFAPGDLLIFLAMVCWSFYTMWLTDFPAQASRVGLLCIHAGLTVVILAPFAAWAVLNGAQVHATPQALIALAYVGVVPSIGAFLLYAKGVALAGPSTASLFVHLIPVYGAVLSVVFLGEQLHLYHAIGFTAILGGIVVAGKPSR
ncbi:hypothetical protein BFP70_11285 [Thioclava sp. SK-1]|uniref:DMT family transporter n=1 Tax=Thioclava sp. SK-1 TaxID=1889770 RepID=UPI0008259CF6|nr:DMT family transporter [Thioclava sp. SK-1]OCX64600.1 hypothetical protein BFP70_11285 [Thioclava sp. SK-1]